MLDLAQGFSPVQRRFLAKVDFTEGCWLWQGYVMDCGYGQFGRGRRGEGLILAHRAAWELFVGPIPEGQQLDHVRKAGCSSRACVRWMGHLEPVTQAENIRRAYEHITHCKQGHPYDETNTYRKPNGRRMCRACRREGMRHQRKVQS